MTTSLANSAPAMGALNEAATADATPQPSSVRKRVGVNRSRWPTQLPSIAPIWTAGPSRPTEAPQPIEIALMIMAQIPSFGDIRPARSALASIASATV